MPIDARTLKNSIATVEAYARAIGEGMKQWQADTPINSVVTGIRFPTFMAPAEEILSRVIDGYCLSEMPPPDTRKLDSIKKLIDRQEKLADYLKFLVKNL